ncbi:MarR family transcriptional regulator [Planotetraspora sp. A-T 1434]|uniref:MarR family winged helix-turn-helix transcriptional regulator n=1 Tax=Planotetraspora sp. A-T 1434 TaxID=2979219 RepID=UPI0021C198B1|nr:MarR family transcriptional regulator [Planotetraspora sp. A-T 1434]MCT9931101.1 MarR family transcriptional regulator [Planotetraspora sp. A-T 1434]
MRELACELPAGLEVDFGWLLGQALHAHLTATKRAADTLPAGHRGYLVLSAAVHESARNQIEMARQLRLDRTVMVYLVDDLVKAGLVERRPDPADRRNRLIAATHLGAERLAQVTAEIDRAEAHLLAALDDHEREMLRNLLRRVVAGSLAEDGHVPSMCEVAENLQDALQGQHGDEKCD